MKKISILLYLCIKCFFVNAQDFPQNYFDELIKIGNPQPEYIGAFNGTLYLKDYWNKSEKRMIAIRNNTYAYPIYIAINGYCMNNGGGFVYNSNIFYVFESNETEPNVFPKVYIISGYNNSITTFYNNVNNYSLFPNCSVVNNVYVTAIPYIKKQVIIKGKKNDGNIVPCTKFTEGVDVFFEFNDDNPEGDLALFVMSGTNWVEQTLVDTTVDDKNYKKWTAVANSGDDINVTLRFKVKATNSSLYRTFYSSNYKELNITVYKKPNVNIDDTIYICNNDSSKISFEITESNCDSVKYSIKCDNTPIDDGTNTINIENSNTVNVNLNDTGCYEISVENIYYINKNDRIASGEYKKKVTVTKLPVIQSTYLSSKNVNCSNSTTNFYFSPIFNDNYNYLPPTGYSIEFGHKPPDSNNYTWQSSPTFNGLEVGTHTFVARYKNAEGVAMCPGYEKVFTVTSTYNQNVIINTVNQSTDGICNATDVKTWVNADYDDSKKEDVIIEYSAAEVENSLPGAGTTSGITSTYTFNKVDSIITIPEKKYNVLGYYTSDKLCLSTTKKVTLTNSYNPLAVNSFTSSNINYCQSNGDGKISLTITGGKPNYTYKLYNSDNSYTGKSINTTSTDISFENIKTTGNYYIIVTDANGCTYTTESKTIGISNELQIRGVSTTPVEGCADNHNGIITVELQNFSGNTNFTLFDGTDTVKTENINDSRYIFSNLESGTYSVKVENANNMCMVEEDNIIVDVNNASVSCSVNNVKGCDARQNGIITVTTQNFTGYNAFTLFNGTDTVETENLNSATYTFDNLQSGTYLVEVKNDNTKCTVNRKTRIGITEASVKYTVTPVTGCYNKTNGKIVLKKNANWLTSPTFTFKYGGESRNGIIDQKESKPINKLPKIDKGILTVTDGTCTFEDKITVTGPDKITFNSIPASDTTLNCYNDVTDITIKDIKDSGSSDNSLENYWFSIDDGKNWKNGRNTFKDNPSGSYNLRVAQAADKECFSDSKIITISANPEPTFTYKLSGYNGYNIECYGETGTLTINNWGNKSIGYYYSTSENSPDYNLIEEESINLLAGTYYVKAKDANNCESAIQTITITQPNELKLSLVSKKPATCSTSNDGSISFFYSGGRNSKTISLIKDLKVVKEININNKSETKDNTGISNDEATEYTMTGLYNDDINDYTIRITDENCTKEITNIELKNAQIVTNITNNVCFGGSSGQIQVSVSDRPDDEFSFNIINSNGDTIHTCDGKNTTATGLYSDNYNISAKHLTTGCFISGNAAVGQNPEISINITSFRNVTTKTSEDGFIKLKVSEGIAPYKIILNGTKGYCDSLSEIEKNLEIQFDSLAADDYTILVTDSKLCSNSFVKKIEAPLEPLSISVNQNNCLQVKCYGEATGQITVTASGGWQGYKYSATGPNNYSVTLQNSNVFNNLYAGVYTITVTDLLGAVETLSYTVTQPEALSITFTNIQNVKCYNESTGSFSLNISGGNGGYQYEFNNNQNFVNYNSITNFTGYKAGTYQFNVVDSKGCTDTNSVTITQPEEYKGSLLANFYNGYSIKCNGLTDSIQATVEGGVRPDSIVLQNNYIISNNNPAIFADLPAGNYHVKFYDNNGCVFNNSIILTQPNQLYYNSSFTEPNCNNNADATITVEAGGGSDLYYNYNIIGNSANNASVDTSLSGNMVVFDSLIAGNYLVNVTDANNCPVNGNIEVTQPEPINYSILSVTNVNCFGDSTGQISLEITGGRSPYTYSINNSDNKSANTPLIISGLAAGNYEIVIFDSSNCMLTINQSITQQPELIGAITLNNYSNNNIRCFGQTDTAFISATGGYGNYSLLFNNQLSSLQGTVELTNLAAGEYTAYITDSYNCADTVVFELVQPDSLYINSLQVFNATCYNQNSGYVQVQLNGGVRNLQFGYNLTSNSFTDYNFFENSDFNTNLSGLYAGNYNLVINDANNCTIDTNFTINQPEQLQIELYAQPVVCKGAANGNVSAMVLNGTPPYNIAWKNINNDTISVTQDAYNLAAGIYTFYVNDANNCLSADGVNYPNQSIEVNEPANALNFSLLEAKRPLCFGNNNGEIKTSVNGGWGLYSYTVNGLVTSNVSTLQNLYASTYKLTVTDSMGCMQTIDTLLADYPQIEITGVQTTPAICNGELNGSIQINVAGGNGVYNYTIDQQKWQSDNLFAGVAARNYWVYVRDSNNCSDNLIINVQQPYKLAVNVKNIEKSISCKPTGKLEVEATGGTGPYTYKWPNNTGFRTGNTIDSLTPGPYYLTVTDINNCSERLFAATITRNDEPYVATVNKTPATCITTADGNIEISVETPDPVTVDWFDANTNTPINQSGTIAQNLLPGKYTARILSQGECYSYYTDSITAPLPLNVGLSYTNVLCKGKSTGSINAQISGGLLPYNVSWYNSNNQLVSNMLNVNNIAAGWYKIGINDQSSCPGKNGFKLIDSVQVTEPENKLSISAPNVNNIDCYQNNNAYVNLNATGGQGGYSFAVNNNSFINNSLFNNLSAGNYMFYVKDAGNCTDSLPVEITQPEKLNALVSQVIDVSCKNMSNGIANITGSGGTQPYNYKLLSSDNFRPTGNFINLNPGNYSCVVKDANLCYDTINFLVNQPHELIVLSDSVKDEWCGAGNGAIWLTPGGGTLPYRVVWDDPDMQTGANISGLSHGNYNALVYDNNNCTTTKSFTLINYMGPELSVAGVEPVTCYNKADGKVYLNLITGYGIHTYNWFNNNHLSNLFSESLPKGNHMVVVTDSHNCSDTARFVIQSPAPLVIQPVNVEQPLCFNHNSGSIQVNASGGIPPYTFTWPNGTVSNTIANIFAGIYNVQVTDSNMCSAVTTIELNQPSKLKVKNIQSRESWCSLPNGYINVIPEGGVAPYTYLWNAHAQINNGRISNIIGGSYTVRINDANNCIIDTVITINNIAGPTLGVKTMLPAKCSYSADGSIELNVDNGTTPFRYTWDNKEQTYLPFNSGYKSGDYYVTIKDARNCCDTLPFEITAPDSLFFVAPDIMDPTCFGYSNGHINANAVGGTPPYNYLWNNTQNTQQATGLRATKYYVTVTDANKCANNNSYTLFNPVELIVDIPAEANICSNQFVELNAQNPGKRYHWYSNNGFESLEPCVTLNKAGKYFIEVVNDSNCIAIDSIVVNVSESTIEANFLLQSEVFVGDTIVMIEISWPVPEIIEWNCPPEFFVIRNQEPELEFVPNSEGYFEVGLTTYTDICTETTSKFVLVKPQSQKPVDNKKSAGIKIIKQVSVTPVPTVGPFNLNIELNQTHNVTIQVVHVTGNTVFTRQLNGNKKYILNFSNMALANGMHFIKVIAGNEQVIKKLIIIR